PRAVIFFGGLPKCVNGGRHGKDAEYRVPSTEYRVPRAEYRVPSAECRVPSTEYRVPSAEGRVPRAGRARLRPRCFALSFGTRYSVLGTRYSTAPGIL